MISGTGYRPLTPETLDLLRRELGGEAVSILPEALDDHSRDATQEQAAPEAVVQVREASQVQALMRLANEHRFPVTPRGAGTGLAGGALPIHGGVVLSLAGMDRILDLDADNLMAVVEPGVVTADLRKAAAKINLFYPPDPASLGESSLGGNAATNAGGPACVKYGVTRHYVLGLEAVLPNGEMLKAGTMTRKGVVGYDLAGLLVGSEGTLGVITKLFLKLIPLPRATSCMAAVFPDLDTAMAGVSGIMAGGVTPSAAEFMDARCLNLVGNMIGEMIGPDGLPQGAAMLLLETDGDKESCAREMRTVAGICRKNGALHLIDAPDDEARDRLWEVRRQVSLRIHDASVLYAPEDVAVPVGRIAALAARLPEIEARRDLAIYAFGHSGDGNIHVNLTADHEGKTENMEAGIRDLLDLVLDLDGTISGEHGIGTAKKRFLPLEQSPAAVMAQQAIKRALDPNMILNPGKIF